MDVLAVDDDVEIDEDEDEAFEAPVPDHKESRRSFNAFKPALRQPAPKKEYPTGELPWWAKTKPGEMTKTAEAEKYRMATSREAKRVSGAIND